MLGGAGIRSGVPRQVNVNVNVYRSPPILPGGQVSPPGLNHEASQAARVQKLKHQSGVC